MLREYQIENALRDADAARGAYCRSLAEHINLLADEVRIRRKRRTERQIHRLNGRIMLRKIRRAWAKVPVFWIREAAGAIAIVAVVWFLF